MATVVFGLDYVVFVQGVAEVFGLDCVVFVQGVVGWLACPFFCLLKVNNLSYQTLRILG